MYLKFFFLATATATTITPASNTTKNVSVTHTSVLHPSLVYPQAVQMAPVSLNASLYCNKHLSGGFKLPPAVGSSGQRYTQAAREQLALITASSLVEIGRIRKKIQNFRSQSQDLTTQNRWWALLDTSRNEVSSQPPNVVFGTCHSDSDCTALSPRRYCLDSVCRECSPSTWQTDCPNSPSNFCLAATNFTCSECLSDSDCSGAVCRSVFPDIAPVPMMPRSVCVACPAVPLNAEITNSSSCVWRCPIGTGLSDDKSLCVTSPVCSASQFKGPVTNDNSFFSPNGANLTSSPVCKECADLFEPSSLTGSCFALAMNASDIVSLGDLNNRGQSAKPCNLFTCKDGWTLNAEKNQCNLCDPGKCPLGNYLSACGGASPGTCLSCAAYMQPNKNMTWIDYRRANISDANKLLACGIVCRNGFYRLNKTTCLACSELQSSLCGPGSVLVNCGPGASTGTCQPCTGLGPGMFWTGHHCQQAACSSRASTCAPGTTLQGCGDTSPGQCVPCAVNKPSNAIAWKASGCDYTCNIGFFAINNTCVNCNTRTCPIGQHLTSCGIDGVSSGQCTTCQRLGFGLYFAQPNTCSPTRCDSTICGPSQKLAGCGYGNPGSCVDCGPVPAGVHFFTRALQIGGAVDCAPGCNPDYQIVDDSSNPLGFSCQPIPGFDFTFGDDLFS